MNQIIRALERARHELTTLHGLRATDLSLALFADLRKRGTPRAEMEFTIDTSAVCASLDLAIAKAHTMNRFQRALDVQSVIMPSRVALILAEEIQRFSESQPHVSEAMIARDPALRLIAFKLAELMGGVVMAREWNSVREECKRMAYAT